MSLRDSAVAESWQSTLLSSLRADLTKTAWQSILFLSQSGLPRSLRSLAMTALFPPYLSTRWIFFIFPLLFSLPCGGARGWVFI
ncbi:hypothetical protein [Helicobacter sp. T3_23-1056]